MEISQKKGGGAQWVTQLLLTDLFLPDHQNQHPPPQHNLTQLLELDNLRRSASASYSHRPPHPPLENPPPLPNRPILNLQSHFRLFHRLDIHAPGADIPHLSPEGLFDRGDLGFERGEIVGVRVVGCGFGGIDPDGVFGGAFAALFFEGEGAGGEGFGCCCWWWWWEMGRAGGGEVGGAGSACVEED